MQNSQIILSENVFAQSVHALADRDDHLAEVVQKYGEPPLWVREPGFPTLVYIILEQQVSLASAKAAFDRLKTAVRPLTPGRFLKLTDSELLHIGFSRQKTVYTHACSPILWQAATSIFAISTTCTTMPRAKCSWHSKASANGPPTSIS